jgi:LacI family transcriptional regulator
MRGRIDGLILMAPDQGSAEVIDRVSRRFPVVLLNPRSTVDTCSTVSIANFDGASAVVRHLLDVGHRRIVIIKGPPGNVDADERLRGYREALARAKVPHDGSLELQGDFTESSGYELAARVLDLRPRPAAIFSTNDCMAVGVLSALTSLGIDVPGDIAMAGFDDVTIARYMNPPLTTAHVDAFQLGSRAVSLLIAARPSASPSHELIDAQLVVRSSCGARPARTTNRGASPFIQSPSAGTTAARDVDTAVTHRGGASHDS